MVTVFVGVECSFDEVHLPDWLVAVIAAVAGSIVGILFGFLLYWCCCKRYCVSFYSALLFMVIRLVTSLLRSKFFSLTPPGVSGLLLLTETFEFYNEIFKIYMDGLTVYL